MEQGQPSQEEVHAFMGKMSGYLTGSLVMSCMTLGDRLGLFEALRTHGPITPAEFAEKLNLNERLIREWLYMAASAGVITLQDNKFLLSPVQKLALTNEKGSPFYFLGGPAMAHAVGQESSINLSLSAFKSGQGAPYEAHDFSVHASIAKFLAPWKRHYLVPTLSSLEGAKAKLEAGAKVGDVGCGFGESLISIAKAYPRVECHGFDHSHAAIEGAKKRLEQEDQDIRKRIFFHSCGIDGSGLPEDHSFDFFITNDCLHDMAHPTKVASNVRRAMHSDGLWLAEEPVCMDDGLENVRKNPTAALFYSASIFACLPSSMSGEGGSGEAMGAQGFTPSVAKRLFSEAGFASVTVHQGTNFHNPYSLFYEVRPEGRGRL